MTVDDFGLPPIEGGGSSNSKTPSASPFTSEQPCRREPSWTMRPLPSACSVLGAWEVGKSDGLASLQNPQVQVWTDRRTHIDGELYASLHEGEVVEIWALGKSMWGSRRFEWSNTLHTAHQMSSETGDSLLCFELEVPQNEVVTFVLARSSCHLNVSGEGAVKGKSKKQRRRSRQGPPPQAEQDLEFLLRLRPSCPFKQGPELLKQRALRADLTMNSEEVPAGSPKRSVFGESEAMFLSVDRRRSGSILSSRASSSMPSKSEAPSASPTVLAAPSVASAIVDPAAIAKRKFEAQVFGFVRARELLKGKELEDFEAFIREMEERSFNDEADQEDCSTDERREESLPLNLNVMIPERLWDVSECICWEARVEMDRCIRAALPGFGGCDGHSERQPGRELPGLVGQPRPLLASARSMRD